MSEYKQFISGSHNFKIDMEPFMHSVANCVNNNLQFAVVYKMLKDVGSDNMVIVDNVMIKKVTGMDKGVYSRLMKRMNNTDLFHKVEWTGKRGSSKYMINPYIIYNYRKCKSNQEYADNCELWNYYDSRRD